MPRKKVDIAVLDIDDTICDNSIAEHNVDEFTLFLKNFIGKHGSVYIITARRRKEDGETVRLNNLLSSYVNPRIIQFLKDINKGKPIREWFYFNESEDELVKYVNKEACKLSKELSKQTGKPVDVMSIVDKFIPKDKNYDEEGIKIMFYMGVVKMFQIRKILLKEMEKHKVPVDLKLQFFDDSRYNLRALKLFRDKLKDPIISKHVYFKGGTGKPVFGGTKVYYLHPHEGLSKIELPKYI